MLYVAEFAKSALSRKGIQVHRRPGLIGFLRSRKIELVLDVGANKGQFGSELRQLGYSKQIISFEPIEDVYNQLNFKIKSDINWVARQMALGETAERRPINVSKSSVYSSFMTQDEFATTFDSQAEISRTEYVQVETLDNFLNEFSGIKTFLKIDTQGFEKSVLDGARRSLETIVGVQLELSVEHLYKNTWNIEEAIAYMRDANFLLAQVNVVSSLRNDAASALEFDCIFRRNRNS